MAKVIAIANNKGGTGKTTTCASLGVGLANRGKRVLLIDADAQGSLTASMGIQRPDNLEITLATIMGGIITDDVYEGDYGIIHNDEGVDLMPANIELSGIELSLVNLIGRETIMNEFIKMVSPVYDFILIDCSPSLGMITLNAFSCADSILIPVQAAYLPVKGLEQLLKVIGKIKRQINPKVEIEGILITMFDSRTNYAKDIYDLVKKIYGESIKIYENVIPLSVRAAETSSQEISIFAHDAKGKVAAAYSVLAEEIDSYGK